MSTVAQQYKDDLAKLEEKKAEAVQTLREGITRDLQLLNEFGYSYTLVDDADPAPTAKQSKRKSEPKPEPCGVCKFETLPPHNARNHPRKTPKSAFGAEELALRGLQRVMASTAAV